MKEKTIAPHECLSPKSTRTKETFCHFRMGCLFQQWLLCWSWAALHCHWTNNLQLFLWVGLWLAGFNLPHAWVWLLLCLLDKTQEGEQRILPEKQTRHAPCIQTKIQKPVLSLEWEKTCIIFERKIWRNQLGRTKYSGNPCTSVISAEPYFWSEYTDGIPADADEDYWNDGALNATGPWGGAVCVNGSTQLRSTRVRTFWFLSSRGWKMGALRVSLPSSLSS